MKRVLCWIGGIVLVLAAVLAIVISQLDTEFISGQISAAVEKATGTPVRFASPPELSLLPPGAKFTAVSWDGVQDGQGMRFTAKGGEAHLELEPLLHGELVIGEVRLDSPSLSLLLPEGKAAAPADAASGNAAGNKPGSEVLLPLELGRLTLSKGSLHVEKGSERYDLRDINLSVENLRNGQDAVLRCDFTYDLLTAGRTLAGTLALDAQAGLAGDGDLLFVEHRAAHGNAAAYGKAIHRKHADVAHTLAERDDHAAVRAGNIQPRTDRRRHRRFDQAHLANAVRRHSVHHRTALHFRNTARYRHNGARHENAAVRHLFQVVLQRRVHQRQIGNHTARHGLDHAHAIARPAKHFIRAAAHGHHTVRVFIYGDDVRFIHHNALAVLHII